MRLLLLVLAALAVTACSTTPRRDPSQTTAATVVDPFAMAAADGPEATGEYRIGATDKLSVTVFQVPDLSFPEIVVDASGNIQMPMIGSVQAAGLTPNQLSGDIARRLGERYLRNPQVTVTVKEAASQKVTVDGAVKRPGVYEMRGRTTLLQAVAMAEGPAPAADIQSVAVFRTVGGQRMVAVFDLAAIRNGAASDPVLLGDDVVVVDTSRLNATLREAIATLPALSIFTLL
ncbi:MAG TPA: polysaccharide biosynthesis/export family protein [Brevundimonas sp.]|jgi:polysaccharide export outer membrane protein|uniref:polysaccharide biosynthesis/export family protein n=1 Tax=Brevundimonas sp. TaxID=1871086 RepID=UPI002DEDF6CA|nr:polysaccharide biosynthesis/export family protein [Brevundimonas sp.]